MHRHGRILAAAGVFAIVLATGVLAQQPPPTGGGRGRVSPPQPQQAQGVEYLAGRWSFSWTGRESPLTVGPRTGTTTFTRKSDTTLDIRTEGTADDGSRFQESGSATWDQAAKTLRFAETLLDRIQLSGTGDWSSPLSIRYESEPVTVGGETLRVRRTYSILSAHSFSVAEEISTGGGAWVRLGQGVYMKENF